jgi:hypothetical protein
LTAVHLVSTAVLTVSTAVRMAAVMPPTHRTRWRNGVPGIRKRGFGLVPLIFCPGFRRIHRVRDGSGDGVPGAVAVSRMPTRYRSRRQRRPSRPWKRLLKWNPTARRRSPKWRSTLRSPWC